MISINIIASFGGLVNGVVVVDFRFSYTVTDHDAYLGKVTFKAEAHLRDARDALPADNEAISRPVKVMLWDHLD